jgi:hypothetical protein
MAAQGAAPYILTSPSTNYILDTDVTVDGTAFVYGAKDVTLDLNGHTITYGNAAPIVVNNGGFETGSGTSVAGWNLANAPAAVIAPNDNYMYGSKVLRLSNISTAQYIVSDTIALTASGREYAATITPKSVNDYDAVKLSVIDAVTGEVITPLRLSSYDSSNVFGTSPSPYRGYSAVVVFVPTATQVSHGVKLRVDVTPQAGKSSTFSLDYATLTPSRDYGVMAAWDEGYFPTQLNTTAIHNAITKANGPTLKNGVIRQGQANGYQSTPVFFYKPSVAGTDPILIDGIETHSSGIDTPAINVIASLNTTVQNCTLYSTTDNVTNRMGGYGLLSAGGSSNMSILNNELYGSPQGSISPGGGTNIVVRGNTIQPNAVNTDGYAIGMEDAHGFEISNNTVIIPDGQSGRGILLDCYYNSDPSSDGQIFGNYIDVQEKPTREYGANLTVTAFRVRSFAETIIGWKNIQVHDNTFIARTGPGKVTGAVGGRYFQVANTANEPVNFVMQNNVFKAIVGTTDTTYWARAFSLENNFLTSVHTAAVMKNNVFESNDISLGFGGPDGASLPEGTFLSNTIRKNTTEGAVRAYEAIHAGYWNGEIHNVQLIDMRYENGATPTISWYSTGVKDISIGSLLGVQVQNTLGGALAGATVTVLDKTGAAVFTGTTDASGAVTDISVVTTIYRQTTSSPSAITTDARGPFTIQVSKTGYQSSSQSNALSSSQTLTVQLLSQGTQAGVQITPSGGSTVVAEGGATDSYTAVLTSQPTANVTITVSPNGQVTVDKTTLTFTPSNWNVAQTVTITGVDDKIAEGAHTGAITHSAASTDAAYNGLSVAGVTAQITDNDTAGVQITQSGGTTNVAEGGATDSYTVVLTSQPTANVTVTVAPNSQVSVDKTTLTFTSSNWNVAQTVTVTAVNDALVEGNHTGTITHTVASSDSNYSGLAVAGVTAQITDNDSTTAGVQITQSSGSTNVTEGGATDSYTVVLSTQPTANVTIAVAPSSQVSVDKTTLTFTPSNWNVAQTVTVTAVNDNVAEGAHAGTITHTAASTDAAYNGLSVAGVTAQITDNDTAGVQIVQSGGSTSVAEGGATDSYTVALTSQPTANVTVAVAPSSQVSVDKTTLTFTPSNWNVAQTVTVTAVNDNVAEGAHTGTITHTAASSDARYNGLAVAGVTAQITDNDTAGLQITQSGGSTNVTEGAATDSYTVALTSRPTANVTITVSPDSQVSADKTTLTFTPSNWNLAQTVTVTAVDDAIAQGAHNGTIAHTVSSTDAKYSGLAAASVTAQITDNEPIATDEGTSDFNGNATADFNGDRTADVLWYNQSTGNMSLWIVKNGAYTSALSLGTSDPATLRPIGIGDFNGDGTADILWQNPNDGKVSTWLIRNGVVSATTDVATVDPGNFRLTGIGDFNGDGTADILWQNRTNGNVGTWLMRNGAFNSWSYIANTNPVTFKSIGVGDLNGDSTADILWQNQANGNISAWTVRGGTYGAWAFIANADLATLKPFGVGDFNGDRTADIVLKDQTNGNVSTWIIRDSALKSTTSIAAVNPTNFKAAGVADFNGDGTSDVLWQNKTNGNAGAWTVRGGAFSAWTYFNAIDPAVWTPVARRCTSTAFLQADSELTGSSASTATLAQRDLQSVVTVAIDRWLDSGLNAFAAGKLRDVRFVIGNLPGTCLAETEGNVVYIDADAAGHGWFVDPTPKFDEEFAVQKTGGGLKAIDPRAVDRIDLLTVLEHEMGHVLGLDDLEASLDDLMSAKLGTGIRRLPTAITP